MEITSQMWANPPPNFQYVLFARVDAARNEERFYYLAWMETLIDAGAVVRLYGRRGGQQRLLITPFPSLPAAWPKIRRLIRTRLQHGYRMVKAPHNFSRI